MSSRSFGLLPFLLLFATTAHAEDPTYWSSYLSVGITGSNDQPGYVYGTSHDGQKTLHNGDGSTALAHGHMAYYDGYMTSTAHGCAGVPVGGSSQSASGSTETRLSDVLFLRSDTLAYNTPLKVTFGYSFAWDLYVTTEGQGVYSGTGGASGTYNFSLSGSTLSANVSGQVYKDGMGMITGSGKLDGPFSTFTTTLYANNPQSYVYFDARLDAGGGSTVQGGQTSRAGASLAMTFGGSVAGDGYLFSGNGGAPWGGSFGNAGSVLLPNPANPTPEPSAFAVLGLGVLALVRRQRA